METVVSFELGLKVKAALKLHQYTMDPETLLSLALNETNSSTTGPEKVCSFQEIGLPLNYQALFHNSWCLKHSATFTALLCVLNSLIFICGVGGNLLIIYFVAFQISNRTASSVFILNLAAADLFVVLFCVPSTLLANVFQREFFTVLMYHRESESESNLVFPVYCLQLLICTISAWVLGNILCKGVSYAQGVFVIISVYSLVAISFDR